VPNYTYKMNSLSLIFENCGSYQLTEVHFYHPLAQSPRFSIRGKDTGIDGITGTFQWTSAVKATVALFLKAKFFDLCPKSSSYPELRGGTSSLAASLDYALSKKPLWLLDMFGFDQTGIPICQRLFSRLNPERKRGGQVTITINSKFLSSSGISIVVNDREVTDITELRTIGSQIIPDLTTELEQRGEPDWIKLDTSNLIKKAKVDAKSHKLTFEKLSDLDTYFSTVNKKLFTDSTSRVQVVGALAHTWWPLIKPKSQSRKEVLSESQSELSYTYSGESNLDEWVANEYAKSGVKSAYIPNSSAQYDLWIYGDHIFQIFLPEMIKVEAAYFFNQISEADDFSTECFTSAVLCKHSEIEMIVTTNSIIASTLSKCLQREISKSL